jgi:ABC-type transport system substrate-binding protein
VRSPKSRIVLGSVIGILAMLLAACGGTSSGGNSTSSNGYNFTYNYKTPTKTGGTVVYGDWQAADSTNLIVNAYLNGTVTDASLDSALYDGCMFELPDLTLKANAWKMSQCKSVDESADGTTTTMHLDPNAKWSDGTPITSQDYRLGYDILADANIYGLNTVPPYNTATVSFPDAATVVINWHQPYGAWRINLLGAMPSQQYKDAFDPTKLAAGTELSATVSDPGYKSTQMQADLGANGSNGNTLNDVTKSVTNGPYMVADFSSDGTATTMVPNPYYFSNYFHKPTISKLIYKIATNKDVLIQSYENGEYDHVEDFTLADALKFTSLPSSQVVVSPAVSFEHLEFNERPQAPNAADNGGKSVFTDINFRKAFIEAFNRCGAIEGILGVDCNSTSIKTNEFTAPPDPSYDPNAPIASFNVPDANKILDAAGYTKDASSIRQYPGTTKEVTLNLATTAGNPLRESFLQLIKQQVSVNLGINVNYTLYKSGKFFTSFSQGGILATGNYDVALFAYSTFAEGDQATGNFDPNAIPSAAHDAGQNEMGINDPKIVQYLTQGRQTIDQDTRIGIYKQMYDYIAQQSYIYPLYIRADITLTQTTLGNYVQNPVQEGNSWNVADWFTTRTAS